MLAGYEWGGRAACIVSALWPDRVLGLITCGEGYNIQSISRATEPAPPEEEVRYWYQYYFHTERGVAGLTQKRGELCRQIWKLWSPTWAFAESTFEAAAASFANLDFVQIVIHSYRHRSGAAEGDPELQHLDTRLALQPDVPVPTVVLQGSDDGVGPPGEDDSIRRHFKRFDEREGVAGAGHNLPQEAPPAFADVVLRLPALQS